MSKGRELKKNAAVAETSMINNFSIAARMMIAFAVMAAIQAGIAAIAFYGLRLSDRDIADFYHARLVPVSELSRINDLMHSSVEQLIIAVIARPSPTNVQPYIERVDKNLKEIDGLAAQYIKDASGDGDKALLADWTSKRHALVLKAIKPAISALQKQDFNEAEDTVLGVAVKQFAAVKGAFDAVIADALSRAENTHEEAEERSDFVENLMFGTAAFTVLFSIVAGAFLSLSIRRRLRRAVSVADAVAHGDLHQDLKADGKDEITDLINALTRMTANLRVTAEMAEAIAHGDLSVEPKPLSDKDTLGLALREMTAKLRTVVSDALSAAGNVSSGSEELSSACQQLSAGANEQAASAEEVSSSMEQMAANIKQNADNARETEKIARQSSADAQASGDAVNRAVEAMQTIAEKITFVQEIARQTDLLALNAAVEAARAGEHGKGFAVVASEVRKLAERSQTAAGEISALSGQTVSAAREAGAMLAKLVPDIKKTAELVEEISAACREQDIGANQVNQAIQQLDKVIQQNAGAAEEMSATSEALSGQAEALQTSIEFFKTGNETGQANAAASAFSIAVVKNAAHPKTAILSTRVGQAGRRLASQAWMVERSS